MNAGQFSFHTPRTPPTTKEDDLTFLRLIRSRRVGPATFHRLIAEHGSASAGLAALPGIARAAGLREYAPCPEAVAETELRAGQRAGAQLLRCDSADYPALLRDIPDAPPVIWVRGDLSVLSRVTVAVIGARNVSSLGLRMTRGMASGLGAAGCVTVSGLARGVDTAAHEASVGTGTVAVMAGGIDVIYPAENAALAEAIAEAGLLVTEQPPGVEPQARHFPSRNRIISGLSRAVVVIEAAQRSGSLITARNALDQGREVMAVPGHPMDARAAGGNALIRDGALLVRHSADVLAALQDPREAASDPHDPVDCDSVPQIRPTANAPTSQVEAQILRHLGPSPVEEDILIRDLGLSPSSFANAILSLELTGQVARQSGGRLTLAP